MTLTFTPADGSAANEVEVFQYKGGGVGLAMFNTDEVILNSRSSSRFVSFYFFFFYLFKSQSPVSLIVAFNTLSVKSIHCICQQKIQF